MAEIIVKTERWDEGLPLGNGKLGSIVYGSRPLKITVDRTDLWDLRPNKTTLEERFNYRNLVKLSTSDNPEDWKERQRLFEDIFMGEPYPSKITAGRVELDFGVNADEVRYSLDTRAALASVYCGDQMIADVFASKSANVGVIRTYRDCKLALHVPSYLSGRPGGGSGLDDNSGELSLGYPEAVKKRDGGFYWYEQNTHTDYSFGIVTYRTHGAIYYALVTTDDARDYIGYGKRLLEKAAAIGCDKLLAAHKREWRDYRRLSSVRTGDKLIDETYEKSWYLFGSCSAKGGYPMPLQGVWTADNDCLPPWKGDYHHDTNTELSYCAFLKANRLSAGEAFIDYLWKLKPAYERFARDFFGVDGLLIPSCSTLDGKPMGGWAQYSLSPTMTIWAAQSFDEYYLYTGDAEFLKNRAYPFFKGVGRAIASLLYEKNGRLYLPLSSSPEIFDDAKKAYLEPNSNFDLALLRYLFGTLKKYAETLGENADEYAGISDKLDDIAIDEDGVVMLDRTRRLPETHRHFSHVMCLYPLHLINYDTDEHKRIYENTILHLETLGTGQWVGFSFAMSAALYAMAKKGNAAGERLTQFCRGFVGENGFHLNGDYKHYGYTRFHYRPFTLESLFGFCDALQEMLMQDHEGGIELFPAVPDEWKNRTVEFKSLRSRGGMLVSAKLINGVLARLSVESDVARAVTINGAEYALKKGKNILIGR